MYTAGSREGPVRFSDSGGVASANVAGVLLEQNAVSEAAASAAGALEQLRGATQAVPDLDSVALDVLCREAAASSRIEGVAVEAFPLREAASSREAKREKTSDIPEALGAVFAYQRGQQSMRRGWPPGSLIKPLHGALYSPLALAQPSLAARAVPGKYREVQNWIGPPGAGIGAAVYIPPAPEEVGPLMREIGDLANDVTERSDKPAGSAEPTDPRILVASAVLHADFEGVHPFVDGNGRVGRLLFHLMLGSRGLYGGPSGHEILAPISEYLERARGEYYRLLNESRKSTRKLSEPDPYRDMAAADSAEAVRARPYEEWTIFFMGCLREAAMEAAGFCISECG